MQRSKELLKLMYSELHWRIEEGGGDLEGIENADQARPTTRLASWLEVASHTLSWPTHLTVSLAANQILHY